MKKSRKKVYYDKFAKFGLFLLLSIALGAILFVGGVYYQHQVTKNLSSKNGAPVGADVANMLEDVPPFLNPLNESMQQAIKDDPDFFLKELRKYSERPCKTYTEGAYHQYVRAKTSDNSQYLIGHGCGASGFVNSVFIKQADGKWLKIGAPEFKFNNQDVEAKFDNPLDLATCEIVNKYSISKDIMPVCYNDSTDSYRAR